MFSVIANEEMVRGSKYPKSAEKYKTKPCQNHSKHHQTVEAATARKAQKRDNSRETSRHALKSR